MENKIQKPLLVKEIFYSIQGEGQQSGLPFIFIRLSGCNLRCIYCDSAYAFKGGELLSFEEILKRIRALSHHKNILITGGEPLLQRPTPSFIQKLLHEGYHVSIETHGEHPLLSIPEKCHILMDIKTPGSGMCRMGFIKNLKHLKPTDEIKFVLTSQDDYFWSKEIIQKYQLHSFQLVFSPVQIHSSFTSQNISLPWLADQILKDQLYVRLQTQFHKIIWGEDCPGR